MSMSKAGPPAASRPAGPPAAPPLAVPAAASISSVPTPDSDSEPDPARAAVRRFTDPDYQPLAATLGELRAGIDALDDAIVDLIAQRAMYVKDAARFKLNSRAVAAPARQADVYRRARALAQHHNRGFDGLDDVVEEAYRAMVAAFIACEGRYFDTMVPTETDRTEGDNNDDR